MQIILNFDKNTEGKYHLAQSDLKMDFGLNKKKGRGIFGERVVILNNFVLNTPRAEQTYQGPQQTILPNAGNMDNQYWEHSRPDSLKSSEDHIYHDIDKLANYPIVSKDYETDDAFVSRLL